MLLKAEACHTRQGWQATRRSLVSSEPRKPPNTFALDAKIELFAVRLAVITILRNAGDRLRFTELICSWIDNHILESAPPMFCVT